MYRELLELCRLDTLAFLIVKRETQLVVASWKGHNGAKKAEDKWRPTLKSTPIVAVEDSESNWSSQYRISTVDCMSDGTNI